MPHSTRSRRAFLRIAATAAASLAVTPAGAQPQDLTALTLKQASEIVRRRRVSPVELTQACLDQIARHDSALNAFITVDAERALATARQMEAEQRRARWRGPLHGIPIALKDNIDTASVRTTAASALFKDRVPGEDAEVTRRLEAAGAVLLGKLNLHEFAYGGTSDISYFGPVRNPWALDHIAGGSSGGSAAAVAANLCFGALGTDTAGSVRIPASYCGVVGFKPTYGRVSLRGVIPLSWTLDHCGPICRTVEDAALMLQAIAGYDHMDPASVDVAVPDYARAFRMDASKLRVGIPRSPFFENLDPEVASAVEAALAVLQTISSRVSEAQVPPTFELLLPITGPEAYAYHARFLAESADQYQPFTRDRIIEFGGDVRGAAYADALRQAQLLRREITKLFTSVDVLITPTMPRPAETSSESRSFDPLGLQNTSPFNILGLPTISVPCGFTKSGLPIGLQLSGAPFAESAVLALAHAFEEATLWHTMHPRLTSA